MTADEVMMTETAPVNGDRRRRILIAGYMGFGNAGDEAILASMLEGFRALPVPVDFTVVSGNPAETSRRYSVSAVPWQDPLALADAVRISDVVLLGGGGLFHDYWGFDPDLLLTPHQWGLSYFAAPAVMAALYRKPLMLYAVGVGPLVSDHGRAFTRFICDAAARITVRDHGSREALQLLGVPDDRIVVTADPAFALNLTADAISEGSPAEPFLIGVAPRTWKIGVDEAFWQRQVAGALDLILEEQPGKAVFVSFQNGSGAEDDPAAIQGIVRQMRHADRVEIRSDAGSADEIAAVLRQCRVVLAMRLHALILSALAGVPFVALEYDPKVTRIAGELALEEFTLPLGGVDDLRLAGLLRRALANHSELSGHLRRASRELSERAQENVRMAGGLLGGQTRLPELPPEFLEMMARVVHSQMRFAAAAAREHATREAEIDRLRADCAELATNAEEARVKLDELESLHAETRQLREQAAFQAERTAQAELRIRHLCHELDLAWNERWTVNRRREEANAGSAYTRFLEARLATLEEKSFAAVSKRGLQVVLDLLQLATPEFLRAAVRRYYLEYFYYRIYPERRPHPAASPAADPVTAAPGSSDVVVYSGYAPFVEFKNRLVRNLPMDFTSISCGTPGLVSVVLPVYNGQRYIRDSIRSVLAQTYQNLELIVVDDGSTDQTPQIVESFAGDPRVRIIHQANQKLPSALTNGFCAATGEFYTWTSDDNVMMPNQLTELVHFLSNRPEVEFVYADEEIIDEEGRPAFNSDFCPGYQTPVGSNLICWPRDTGELNFVQNNYIGGCFLYRAWAGQIVGGYDPACFGFEDYEYWMRMNALFRISHLGARVPLYQYRLHGSSLSAREKQLRIIDRVREFMTVEEARRHFFVDNFDITFVGLHNWFGELGKLYREYGNNLFHMTDVDDTSRYHHEVTRAFSKAAVIFSANLPVAVLERALVWSRREHTLTVLLVDDDSGPAVPDAVLNAFDCIVATGEIARRSMALNHSKKLFVAGTPDSVAYPLLALINRTCYNRRRRGAVQSTF